jgi:hypothetical protein
LSDKGFDAGDGRMSGVCVGGAGVGADAVNFSCGHWKKPPAAGRMVRGLAVFAVKPVCDGKFSRLAAGKGSSRASLARKPAWKTGKYVYWVSLEGRRGEFQSKP